MSIFPIITKEHKRYSTKDDMDMWGTESHDDFIG